MKPSTRCLHREQSTASFRDMQHTYLSTEKLFKYGIVRWQVTDQHKGVPQSVTFFSSTVCQVKPILPYNEEINSYLKL